MGLGAGAAGSDGAAPPAVGAARWCTSCVRTGATGGGASPRPGCCVAGGAASVALPEGGSSEGGSSGGVSSRRARFRAAGPDSAAPVVPGLARRGGTAVAARGTRGGAVAHASPSAGFASSAAHRSQHDSRGPGGGCGCHGHGAACGCACERAQRFEAGMQGGGRAEAGRPASLRSARAGRRGGSGVRGSSAVATRSAGWPRRHGCPPRPAAA